MLQHDYTTAVFSLLEEGKDCDALLTSLKEQLKRKGHQKLLPAILKGLVREIEHRDHAQIPDVRVARADDAVTHKARITDLLKQLTDVTEYTVTVDDTLIGGVVVEHNNTIIDASHKKQLLSLYQSLTN